MSTTHICLAWALFLTPQVIGVVTGPPPGTTTDGASGPPLEITTEASELTTSVQSMPWRNAKFRGLYSGQVTPDMVPEGEGSFHCASHNYTGSWEKGLRHGKGVNVFINDDIYIGEWANDTRHGHGELFWSSGRTYTGHMVRGNME